MGNFAYNYLSNGAPGDSVVHFPDWLGLPLDHDSTWAMGDSPVGYADGQSAPDFTIPSPSYVVKLSGPLDLFERYSRSGFPNHFPLFPSPPPSQTCTPESQQLPLPQDEPGCHQASPVKNAKGKWLCSACGKGFRGHYECKRHIEHAGRRAMCLACHRKINGREDSIRRHYYRHCKRMDLGRDSEDLKFEDAFVHE